MEKEELKKELEKLKDFKVYVFEGDVYVKAEDYKKIAIENKKLKDDLMEDMKEITKLEKENKKLKEEKDFFYKSAKQFREDAESWRKECERLLGLQLCGKTIAERIEDDKKVIRTDTSLMEEDTLQ